jgi:PAS domain S-box-containing protein
VNEDASPDRAGLPLVESIDGLLLPLVEQLEEVVVISSAGRTSAEVQITFVNNAFTRITGYTFDEVAGLPPQFLRGWDPDWTALQDVYARLYRGDAVRANATIMCRAGQELPAEWLVLPLRNRAGEIRHFGAIARPLTQERRSGQLLHELSGRLLRVQDEERRMIARELHDSTAQDLAAVAMSLSSLQKRLEGKDANTETVLADSVAVVQQCYNEIRTLSALLHPPLLDALGLQRAVPHYVERFGQRSGLKIELEVEENLGRLGREVETALFRIVQESLGNVSRHSESLSAVVRLRRSDHSVILEVEDQGIGLPAEVRAKINDPAAAFGIGITGMRERLRQLGGALQIDSTAGGTLVRATVPLP